MDAVSRALKAKYGITLKEYERQLKKQGGVCAMCGRPPKNRRLNVDHDHASRRLRGLLCYFDNHFLIGTGRVTADMHRKAAAYLDAPPWYEERFVPQKEKGNGKSRTTRRRRKVGSKNKLGFGRRRVSTRRVQRGRSLAK